MTSRWFAAAALLLFTPLTTATGSSFDGMPGIRFEYYDVEGRTPREIYQSLMARAPNNGQHWGLTKSQSHDRWRVLTEGASCRVIDARTNLSITVLLPRLLRLDEATEEGLAMWRGISERIRAHEAGHARIAWDHRDEFRRAAAKANCKTVKRVAREVGDKVRARQQAFDRDTDYGRKGAPRLIL